MLNKLKVKYIQSLGQKKFRDEEDVYIAEGPKIIKELLMEEHVQVKEVFALEEWLNENRILTANCAAEKISQQELDKISRLTTPNQVLAIIKKNKPLNDFATHNKITLALDEIKDPGNLGTILRIADWFGVEQIVCSNDCADIYNPKVVQATMGSIARVNVIYTDIGLWLSDKKENIYAATLNGQHITAIKPLKEGIIIIGNESKGIRDELIQLASIQLTIPRAGKAESLNAAVATGIILSHLMHKA